MNEQNKEIILKLIEIRKILTLKLTGGGNYANDKKQEDYFNPKIEKVDDLIKLFRQK